MQNIEIKARYDNLEQAKSIALEMSANFEGALHQIDTYFNVRKGRLKLREINFQESQLIFYERPDQIGAKLSQYQIYPVEDAAHLKVILESALGIWCVVEKQRELYLFDEVRIHLDRVKHLGNFLELEGVLSPKTWNTAVKNKVEWLVTQFKISKADLIEVSYSDLFDCNDAK